MRGLRRVLEQRAAMIVIVWLVSCTVPPLPPRGEAIIVVDTDMPIPKMVSHVRVDVYSTDGKRWIASHDISRPRPEEWPFTFSVYTEALFKDALVRLRAYPEGYVRDYRGERFSSKPDAATGADRFARVGPPSTPFATKDCPNCPRLQSNGVDVTPLTEPLPLVTIDRLVHVSLVESQVGKTVIVLSGACMGTQADLAGGTTCIDTEATLETPPIEHLDLDLRLPASHAGEFEKNLALPCTVAARKGRQRIGAPIHDEEVCVPGGVFLLGGTDNVNGSDNDDFPQRVAIVPTLLIDRYEYSVARFRQAQDDGYAGPFDFIYNDGPANDTALGHSVPAACTLSHAPMGREDAPLNCIVQDTARELCKFDGGDLPLEVQWEYVATWAGRSAKSLPSILGSNGLVECKGVAMARDLSPQDPSSACTATTGFGTAPVTFGQDDPIHGDVAFGIVGFWGGVSERARDAFASMSSICWLSAPMVLPNCEVEMTEEHASTRGAHWRQPLNTAGLAWREGVSQTGVATTLGFRCVREAR
jgi:formylglycine-generating enzyme required for sulfatase activity